MPLELLSTSHIKKYLDDIYSYSSSSAMDEWRKIKNCFNDATTPNDAFKFLLKTFEEVAHYPEYDLFPFLVSSHRNTVSQPLIAKMQLLHTISVQIFNLVSKSIVKLPEEKVPVCSSWPEDEKLTNVWSDEKAWKLVLAGTKIQIQILEELGHDIYYNNLQATSYDKYSRIKKNIYAWCNSFSNVTSFNYSLPKLPTYASMCTIESAPFALMTKARITADYDFSRSVILSEWNKISLRFTEIKTIDAAINFLENKLRDIAGTSESELFLSKYPCKQTAVTQQTIDKIQLLLIVIHQMRALFEFVAPQAKQFILQLAKQLEKVESKLTLKLARKDCMECCIDITSELGKIYREIAERSKIITISTLKTSEEKKESPATNMVKNISNQKKPANVPIYQSRLAMFNAKHNGRMILPVDINREEAKILKECAGILPENVINAIARVQRSTTLTAAEKLDYIQRTIKNLDLEEKPSENKRASPL